VRCSLKESFNGGASWSMIKKNVKGRDHIWKAIPWNNTTEGKVKVTCYRKNGSKAGSDSSDGFIRIEVVRTVIPSGGEVLNSGDPFLIEWITNKTRKKVDRVKLMLSRDGGTTWEKIDVIEGNPGFYEWLVPSFGALYANCKIKVILLSKTGRKVGSSVSMGLFTIIP
jgi:hypothetical protein